MATKIEWTDETWNPLRGCSKVSEGCRNCYAMGVAYRFSGPGQPYEGLATKRGGKPEWTNVVRTVPEMLEAPLHWRKPRRIFVNSMSDLFHPDVPRDFIEAVFRVMLSASQHTYQILTKRPERMAEDVPVIMNRICGYHWAMPPFIWLGTSVENQATADERIPHLLRCPAAVRWLSCEPLLGPVDLCSTPRGQVASVVRTWLSYNQRVRENLGTGRDNTYCRIDWVIAGGESGPSARPMHPDWARSLRDQCQAARVKFFFKQWGEHAPLYDHADHYPRVELPDGLLMACVGKHAAGRMLDGRTWDEYPEVQR